MLDRQDIDALLIGSLFGELSSTEEARLTAHLESHPADRTALANLSRARDVVRESRILQTQFEPAQSISALLMQEAARRAPKPREEQGWFQRFMRSFMSHPAMAAAAMLVLIVGVAGTVYIRKGDHFAKQTKEDTSGMMAPAAPAATPPAEQQRAADEGAAGKAEAEVAQGSASAADNFKVQLDDDSLKKQAEDKIVDDANATDRARNLERTVNDSKQKNTGVDLAFDANDARRDQNKVAKDQPKEVAANGFSKQPPAKAGTKTAASKPAAKSPRLEVTTPTQRPKDFADTTTAKLDTGTVGGAGVAGGGGPGAGGASAPRAPKADPKPGTAPPPPPPAPTVATEEKKEQAKPDPQLAWAKEQHGKVIAAVKAGNCDSAANIAVQISNRAPAYYASNVETDRTIKQCMQYITAQREKDAERAQRAKSTQRRAADEAPAPAKAAPTSTK